MRRIRQIGPDKYALVNEGGEATHIITRKGPHNWERMSMGRFPTRKRYTSLAQAVEGQQAVRREVAEGCYVI